MPRSRPHEAFVPPSRKSHLGGRARGPGSGAEPCPCPPHQVAAVLTLPFDVVKTQRQVALGAMEAVRGEGLSQAGVSGDRQGHEWGLTEPASRLQ